MSSTKGGTRAAFSSLHIVDYRRLWWAGTFSFMAVQMQFLLRGVLAWDLTEREGALGLVYLCFGVTMLVATPLGGVAADRLPKRRVMLVSQTALLVGATGMGIAVLTDVVALWMLLVASVIQGAAFGFYGPARIAFTSEIVGREQLGNAITLSMLSMNGTRVFAPSLAGAIAGIAVLGIGGAYLVSAALSALALVSLLRCPERAAPSGLPPARPLEEIMDGVRYVRARPPLRRLVVFSFLVIMFGFNYVAFIPALVKGSFDLGDGSVGLLMSASSIGAVIVAVAVASRADGPSAWNLMIVAGIVFGGGVMVLGGAPNFVAAFLIVAVVGGGATGFQSLSNTIALNLTEDSHQGRVQSLMMLSFAGFGIAAAPLGLLAEVIGLRLAIALMGAVAMIGVITYAVLDRVTAEVEPGAEFERPAATLTPGAVNPGTVHPGTVPVAGS